MIYIRVDANEIVSSGHMMRCLTIAEKLQEFNQPVTFLLADNESVKLVKKKKFDFVVLNTDWSKLSTEKEYEYVKKILVESCKTQGEYPILLVDSYYVSPGYFVEMQPYAKLVAIDDLHVDNYDVDVLINYSIYQEIFDYSEYNSLETKLLLGTEYVPLRKQFQEIESVPRNYNKKESLRILLICGGGDPFRVLPSILSYGEEYGYLKRYEIMVVAGAYNPYLADLLIFEEKHTNIHVKKNVENMAELMSQCDVAVSAAGTVLYECAAMGLPTIFFCMVDNQEYDGLYFSKNELMLYAGDYRFDKQGVIASIYRHLQYLDENRAYCTGMSSKLHELVDGKGAERIVRALICAMEKE